MPLSGSGHGSAFIDLTHKQLTKAHVEFEVPVTRAGTMKIGWNESVHLELME